LTVLFVSASSTFTLPQGLLSSLCYVESRHRPSAYNKTDGSSPSLGICQIKLETAKTLGYSGTAKGLMKPATNVYYAAKYLKKQLVRYKHDIQKAIAAYNAGTYFPDAKGQPKNKQYVRKVLLAWASNR